VSDWITTPTAHALGWTLVHSLWQVAAVALVVAPTLALMRRRDASLRYLLCCLGMGAMLALPTTTFVLLRWTAAPELAPVARMLMSEEARSATLAPALSSSLPWLTAGWMLGVSFFAARSGLFWVRARRLSRTGLRPAPNAVQRMVVMIGSELRLRRRVRVFESALASVPSVVGWLSPVVLLPVGACQALTVDQVRSIVAHEMAHVRRHDQLVNWLQTLFECLLFFHPAAWWLSGRLRAEREYCCDDVAVGLCGNARQYARALWTLETLRGASHPADVSTGGVALSSHGGSLMERITRLVGVADTPRRRPASWLAPGSAALLMVAALAATGFALPQDVQECDVEVDCPTAVECDGGVWIAQCGDDESAECQVTVDCDGDGESIGVVCVDGSGEVSGELVSCEVVTLDGDTQECSFTILVTGEQACSDAPDKLIVDDRDLGDDAGGKACVLRFGDDADGEARVLRFGDDTGGDAFFFDDGDGEPVIIELRSELEWTSDEPDRIVVRSRDDRGATLVAATDPAPGGWSTVAPHAPHGAHARGTTVEPHDACDHEVVAAPRGSEATRAFTVRREAEAVDSAGPQQPKRTRKRWRQRRDWGRLFARRRLPGLPNRRPRSRVAVTRVVE